jgi:hypothetical protein
VQQLRKLALRIVPVDLDEGDGSKRIGVEIRIDGQPFLDMVRKVELGFAGQPAGAYVPASLGDLRLDVEIIGGRPVFPRAGVFGGASSAILLICECGYSSCWSLIADITVEHTTVRWSGLSSTASDRDPAWNYSAIEPLLFERDAYFRAVRAPTSKFSSIVGLLA